MLIQEMTRSECISRLSHTRLGRLGCAFQNQPSIVPIYFAYEDSFLYGFTTPGQKIDWMRSNLLVCVELDEIENTNLWTTIVIFGTYEELPETDAITEEIDWRKHAHALLQQYAEWWEPGAAWNTQRRPAKSFEPVFYRISIDQISGRRVTPDAVGPRS